ncbi:hypothetical protein [Enhygromyxa salina]|uniref:hypothetical protein n=1 Tax=Enhygromyxa salina TaxID=215803 RepID=UPI001969CCF4|nr:hypothetical protein [Enhygromyxa salina]
MPGSVRLCAVPDRPDVARLAVKQADQYIDGSIPVPRGAKGRVDTVVSHLRLVGKDQHVRVSIGKYRKTLIVPDAEQVSARIEVADIRARLVQVSIDPPTGKFRTERFGLLKLNVTEEQAKQLGATLGRNMKFSNSSERGRPSRSRISNMTR